MMMHGNTKIKFVNAKQAKTYYNYKNKRKMYRINAAIWYNTPWNRSTYTCTYLYHLHVHFISLLRMDVYYIRNM